jgi:two-component sensor histidine kinase
MLERIIDGKYRMGYHLLFWVVYVALYTVMWGGYDDNYWEECQQILFLLPTQIVPTYITLYYLMPRFLYRKKTGLFILWSLVLTVVMALIYRYLNWAFLYHWFHPENEYWKTPVWYLPKVMHSLIQVYYPIFVAMAIKLQLFYYAKDKRNKELEKEKVATELKFLKSQIHPHFLFNTLNSIYSLSLSKSDKTPKAVLGLSKFMDYMLYECNDRFISIGREWEQLMNLVELERLRYSDSLTINTNKTIDRPDALIPALLLLPFVENAFKHGVDSELDDSWIHIDLSLQQDQLNFLVENSRTPKLEGKKDLDTDKNIGLKNVKRRLQLFYPDRHNLRILEEAESFLVKLEIDLGKLPETWIDGKTN